MKIDDLLAMYNSHFLNRTDSVLTQYFLGKHLQVQDLLLNDVISETHLSKSTIVRYCQGVGALQFTDFKYQFIQDYKVWRPQFYPDHQEDILQFARTCANIWQKNIIVFCGDQKTMYIWKMYLRDFYQKGYLLRIVSGAESSKVHDLQGSNIYTSMTYSIKKYCDVNMNDMAARRCYSALTRDKNCTVISPIHGNEVSQTKFALKTHDAWGNRITLMKLIETILNIL